MKEPSTLRPICIKFDGDIFCVVFETAIEFRNLVYVGAHSIINTAFKIHMHDLKAGGTEKYD